LNKNSRTASVSVSIVGTTDVVNNIYTWAQSRIGVIDYKPAQHAVTEECKIFQLAVRQGMEFLKHLYDESSVHTRLDRKFAKYQKISSGDRMTREIAPYETRMACKTSRRRTPPASHVIPALKKHTRYGSKKASKDDGIV
jgi:hypothetical protein